MMKEFYAVFVESSYYVEGDERSRTNPGHGYPGGTVSYTSVETFDGETALRKWIADNDKSYSPKKFQAVKCQSLTVNTRIEFDIS